MSRRRLHHGPGPGALSAAAIGPGAAKRFHHRTRRQPRRFLPQHRQRPSHRSWRLQATLSWIPRRLVLQLVPRSRRSRNPAWRQPWRPNRPGPGSFPGWRPGPRRWRGKGCAPFKARPSPPIPMPRPEPTDQGWWPHPGERHGVRVANDGGRACRRRCRGGPWRPGRRRRRSGWRACRGRCRHCPASAAQDLAPAYAQQIAAGKTQDEAVAYAWKHGLATGAISGVVGAIPGGQTVLGRLLFQSLVAQPAGGLAVRTGVPAVMGEPQPSASELISGAGQDIVAGFGMGGAHAIATHGYQRAFRLRRRRRLRDRW